MKNRKRFATYMLGLGEVYDKKLTEAMIEVYWQAMADYKDEEVYAAVSDAVKTNRWFPRPSDIREYIEQKRRRVPVLALPEPQEGLLSPEEIKQRIGRLLDQMQLKNVG